MFHVNGVFIQQKCRKIIFNGYGVLVLEYYREQADIDRDKQSEQLTYWNDNDFDGYKYGELFIEKSKKYDTFKLEIMEYPDMNIKLYLSKIILKSEIYYESETVKSIFGKKPVRRAMRYYDIEFDDFDQWGFGITSHPIPITHIQALIIYTDFTKISSSFSATFRRKSMFESLSSMKKRNQKYYFLSKYLREAVEIYGEYGSDRDINAINGRFFCGMDCL